jgi:hypothetical protein
MHDTITARRFSSTATAEIYNPSTDVWKLMGSLHVSRNNEGSWSLTASMTTGVFNPTGVLLANNDVLIANAAQFYNPVTASWVNTGALPETAGNPLRATLLSNGNVLASGTDCNYSGCGHVPTDTCFLFATESNTWSVTGSMNQARIDHTSTLLTSGKVLIAGGISRGIGTGATVLSSAELYTP